MRPWRSIRRRLGRVELRLRELLARHLRLRRRLLHHRPDRLAGVAVVGIQVRLLGHLEEARDAAAADVDVEQDGRRRVVVVPDVVLHRLLVPHPFAGLDVERDDARAEEVVAGTEAAVVVDGGAVGRDVDEAAGRVGRHRRPRRHVAGPAPRVVLPRVVAELTRPRNHVELPQELAGLEVVTEDVAGDVLDPGLVVALLGRVADDEDVVDDDRRRRGGDVAEFEGQALERVVLLLGHLPGLPVGDEVLQHVDRTGLAEAGHGHRFTPAFDRLAGLGVEGVQEEAGRRDEHDALAVDLRVGHALAVVRPHRVFVTGRQRFLERPQRLAGRRVERHHGAARPRHGDEHPVDVDRQAAAVDLTQLRAGRQVAAVPLPRDLQVVEVRGVDLVVSGIPGGGVATRDRGPVALLLGIARQSGHCDRHDHRQCPHQQVRRPAARRSIHHESMSSQNLETSEKSGQDGPAALLLSTTAAIRRRLAAGAAPRTAPGRVPWGTPGPGGVKPARRRAQSSTYGSASVV